MKNFQVTEQLNGIKEVKSYCIQDMQIEKFSTLVERIKYNSTNFSKIQSIPDMIYKIISSIILSLFFYTTIIFFKVDSSKLLIVIFIFGRLWPLFSTFQSCLQNLFVMLTSYNNIMDINEDFKNNSELNNSENYKNIFSLDKCLEFRNVSFKYSGKEDYSIKNISFKIPSSSFTSLIGLSGAGKTTLANIIMGLLLPGEGSFSSDGKIITE